MVPSGDVRNFWRNSESSSFLATMAHLFVSPPWESTLWWTNIAMERSTMLLMGKSTISMAIFHCYVSSPEGTARNSMTFMGNAHFCDICEVFTIHLTSENPGGVLTNLLQSATWAFGPFGQFGQFGQLRSLVQSSPTVSSGLWTMMKHKQDERWWSIEAWWSMMNIWEDPSPILAS